MEIEFYEADGLTRTGNSVFKCFPGEKEQWTLCSFEGVAPKNAGCAFIHLYLDCGGEIYFDDVLIRKDGLFVLPELMCLNPENLK